MAKRFEKQRRLEPDQDDLIDGITFDKQGRMNYHPDFHPNHKTKFMLFDLIYLCKYYEVDGPRKISFALGRTEHTIMSKVAALRKSGLYDKYKNMSDDEWEKSG